MNVKPKMNSGSLDGGSMSSWRGSVSVSV